MTKAIQRQQRNPIGELSAFLKDDQRQENLAGWCGSKKEAEALKRFTVLAFSNDFKLQKCSPVSIYKACLTAAYTGLMPDGKDAALVAYGGVCQLLPMYQGIMRLALQTGYVANIYSAVANESDVFEVSKGTNPSIDHRLNFKVDDIGKPIAAYAVAHLANGTKVSEVMRWAEIMKVQKAARATKGPWKDWTEQMARKTAIKRLCKGLPLSGEFATAIAIDNAVESGDRLGYEQAADPVRSVEILAQEPEAMPAWDDDFTPPDLEPGEASDGA